MTLALTASVSAKDYHFTTVKGDAMQTRIYTLDNGLKVYMSVNKEKPRLQANIAVRTGSRNDPAETTRNLISTTSNGVMSTIAR